METTLSNLVDSSFEHVLHSTIKQMEAFYQQLTIVHTKKNCPFPLPKFIRFLMKWDKMDSYATRMVLVKND